MVEVSLPDGAKIEFDQSVSLFSIAETISKGLAKKVIAGKINGGELVDLSTVISQNCSVELVTDQDPEGLEVIRHSTAHLLAYAAKSLFPNIQVTIGPVIENGFYYDFSFNRPFVPEDLRAIEKKMRELSKKK